MDPFTVAALGMKAFGFLSQGKAENREAQAEKEQAKINAYIGRTRAKQADTDARAGLTDELGSMRAVLAANGQSANVGTMEMFQELRDVRNRERRVTVGNREQEARDFDVAAKNADRRGKAAKRSSYLKAGSSMFDLAQVAYNG